LFKGGRYTSPVEFPWQPFKQPHPPKFVGSIEATGKGYNDGIVIKAPCVYMDSQKVVHNVNAPCSAAYVTCASTGTNVTVMAWPDTAGFPSNPSMDGTYYYDKAYRPAGNYPYPQCV
jgi:hypothetical protein